MIEAVGPVTDVDVTLARDSCVTFKDQVIASTDNPDHLTECGLPSVDYRICDLIDESIISPGNVTCHFQCDCLNQDCVPNGWVLLKLLRNDVVCEVKVSI